MSFQWKNASTRTTPLLAQLRMDRTSFYVPVPPSNIPLHEAYLLGTFSQSLRSELSRALSPTFYLDNLPASTAALIANTFPLATTTEQQHFDSTLIQPYTSKQYSAARSRLGQAASAKYASQEYSHHAGTLALATSTKEQASSEHSHSPKKIHHDQESTAPPRGKRADATHQRLHPLEPHVLPFLRSRVHAVPTLLLHVLIADVAVGLESMGSAPGDDFRGWLCSLCQAAPTWKPPRSSTGGTQGSVGVTRGEGQTLPRVQTEYGAVGATDGGNRAGGDLDALSSNARYIGRKTHITGHHIYVGNDDTIEHDTKVASQSGIESDGKAGRGSQVGTNSQVGNGGQWGHLGFKDQVDCLGGWSPIITLAAMAIAVSAARGAPSPAQNYHDSFRWLWAAARKLLDHLSTRPDVCTLGYDTWLRRVATWDARGGVGKGHVEVEVGARVVAAVYGCAVVDVNSVKEQRLGQLEAGRSWLRAYSQQEVADQVLDSCKPREGDNGDMEVGDSNQDSNQDFGGVGGRRELKVQTVQGLQTPNQQQVQQVQQELRPPQVWQLQQQQQQRQQLEQYSQQHKKQSQQQQQKPSLQHQQLGQQQCTLFSNRQDVQLDSQRFQFESQQQQQQQAHQEQQKKLLPPDSLETLFEQKQQPSQHQQLQEGLLQLRLKYWVATPPQLFSKRRALRLVTPAILRGASAALAPPKLRMAWRKTPPKSSLSTRQGSCQPQGPSSGHVQLKAVGFDAPKDEAARKLLIHTCERGWEGQGLKEEGGRLQATSVEEAAQMLRALAQVRRFGEAMDDEDENSDGHQASTTIPVSPDIHESGCPSNSAAGLSTNYALESGSGQLSKHPPGTRLENSILEIFGPNTPACPSSSFSYNQTERSSSTANTPSTTSPRGASAPARVSHLPSNDAPIWEVWLTQLVEASMQFQGGAQTGPVVRLLYDPPPEYAATCRELLQSLVTESAASGVWLLADLSTRGQPAGGKPGTTTCTIETGWGKRGGSGDPQWEEQRGVVVGRDGGGQAQRAEVQAGREQDSQTEEGKGSDVNAGVLKGDQSGGAPPAGEQAAELAEVRNETENDVQGGPRSSVRRVTRRDECGDECGEQEQESSRGIVTPSDVSSARGGQAHVNRGLVRLVQLSVDRGEGSQPAFDAGDTFATAALDFSGSFRIAPKSHSRHVRISLSCRTPTLAHLLQSTIGTGTISNDARTDVIKFSVASLQHIVAHVVPWLLPRLKLMPLQGAAATAVILAANLRARGPESELLMWLQEAPKQLGGPTALRWALSRVYRTTEEYVSKELTDQSSEQELHESWDEIFGQVPTDFGVQYVAEGVAEGAFGWEYSGEYAVHVDRKQTVEVVRLARAMHQSWLEKHVHGDTELATSQPRVKLHGQQKGGDASQIAGSWGCQNSLADKHDVCDDVSCRNVRMQDRGQGSHDDAEDDAFDDWVKSEAYMKRVHEKLVHNLLSLTTIQTNATNLAFNEHLAKSSEPQNDVQDISQGQGSIPQDKNIRLSEASRWPLVVETVERIPADQRNLYSATTPHQTNIPLATNAPQSASSSRENIPFPGNSIRRSQQALFLEQTSKLEGLLRRTLMLTRPFNRKLSEYTLGIFIWGKPSVAVAGRGSATRLASVLLLQPPPSVQYSVFSQVVLSLAASLQLPAREVHDTAVAVDAGRVLDWYSEVVEKQPELGVLWAGVGGLREVVACVGEASQKSGAARGVLGDRQVGLDGSFENGGREGVTQVEAATKVKVWREHVLEVLVGKGLLTYREGKKVQQELYEKLGYTRKSRQTSVVPILHFNPSMPTQPTTDIPGNTQSDAQDGGKELSRCSSRLPSKTPLWCLPPHAHPPPTNAEKFVLGCIDAGGVLDGAPPPGESPRAWYPVQLPQVGGWHVLEHVLRVLGVGEVVDAGADLAREPKHFVYRVHVDDVAQHVLPFLESYVAWLPRKAPGVMALRVSLALLHAQTHVDLESSQKLHKSAIPRHVLDGLRATTVTRARTLSPEALDALADVAATAVSTPRGALLAQVNAWCAQWTSKPCHGRQSRRVRLQDSSSGSEGDYSSDDSDSLMQTAASREEAQSSNPTESPIGISKGFQLLPPRAQGSHESVSHPISTDEKSTSLSSSRYSSAFAAACAAPLPDPMSYMWGCLWYQGSVAVRKLPYSVLLAVEPYMQIHLGARGAHVAKALAGCFERGVVLRHVRSDQTCGEARNHEGEVQRKPARGYNKTKNPCVELCGAEALGHVLEGLMTQGWPRAMVTRSTRNVGEGKTDGAGAAQDCRRGPVVEGGGLRSALLGSRDAAAGAPLTTGKPQPPQIAPDLGGCIRSRQLVATVNLVKVASRQLPGEQRSLVAVLDAYDAVPEAPTSSSATLRRAVARCGDPSGAALAAADADAARTALGAGDARVGANATVARLGALLAAVDSVTILHVSLDLMADGSRMDHIYTNVLLPTLARNCHKKMFAGLSRAMGVGGNYPRTTDWPLHTEQFQRFLLLAGPHVDSLPRTGPRLAALLLAIFMQREAQPRNPTLQAAQIRRLGELAESETYTEQGAAALTTCAKTCLMAGGMQDAAYKRLQLDLSASSKATKFEVPDPLAGVRAFGPAWLCGLVAAKGRFRLFQRQWGTEVSLVVECSAAECEAFVAWVGAGGVTEKGSFLFYALGRHGEARHVLRVVEAVKQVVPHEILGVRREVKAAEKVLRRVVGQGGGSGVHVGGQAEGDAQVHVVRERAEEKHLVGADVGLQGQSGVVGRGTQGSLTGVQAGFEELERLWNAELARCGGAAVAVCAPRSDDISTQQHDDTDVSDSEGSNEADDPEMHEVSSGLRYGDPDDIIIGGKQSVIERRAMLHPKHRRQATTLM